MQAPSLPPPPSATPRAPSIALPYAVAAVSCIVLAAVAAIAFLRPTGERHVVEQVIVLDGSGPKVPRPTPEAARPGSDAAVAAVAEPAPGDILVAEITGEGSSGDGVAQVGGLAVYVRGAQRGQTVRFRVLQVRTSRKGNRYATAELVPADTTGEKAP